MKNFRLPDVPWITKEGCIGLSKIPLEAQYKPRAGGACLPSSASLFT
jgi:hypothetical protein